MPGLAVLCSGQGKQDYESFAGILAYPELKSLFQNFTIPGKLKKYLDKEEKAWLKSKTKSL